MGINAWAIAVVIVVDSSSKLITTWDMALVGEYPVCDQIKTLMPALAIIR